MCLFEAFTHWQQVFAANSVQSSCHPFACKMRPGHTLCEQPGTRTAHDHYTEVQGSLYSRRRANILLTICDVCPHALPPARSKDRTTRAAPKAKSARAARAGRCVVSWSAMAVGATPAAERRPQRSAGGPAAAAQCSSCQRAGGAAPRTLHDSACSRTYPSRRAVTTAHGCAAFCPQHKFVAGYCRLHPNKPQTHEEAQTQRCRRQPGRDISCSSATATFDPDRHAAFSSVHCTPCIEPHPGPP